MSVLGLLSSSAANLAPHTAQSLPHCSGGQTPEARSEIRASARLAPSEGCEGDLVYTSSRASGGVR